jgi:hypothetical protein
MVAVVSVAELLALAATAEVGLVWVLMLLILMGDP